MSAKPHQRIIAGLTAGLLVLAGFLVFLPGVQTWYVQRRLASLPGSSVARVSIGFGRAQVRQIRVERAGAVLTVPAVDAQLDTLPAALGRGWHIASLQARGWTLDLTHEAAEPAEAAAPGGLWAEKAVGGIMAALRLPAGFALDDMGLEGDIRFNDAHGRPTGKAHVVVVGGGLAAGSEGRFRCTVTAGVEDLTAPVYSVAVSANLNLTMRPSGQVTRAQLRADTNALGPQFPNGLALACSGSVVAEGGKQTFSVSLVRAGDHVAEFDGSSPLGSSTVSGTWHLNLRDTDLEPFALGRILPAFYVTGRGSYDGDAFSGDLHASGNLQGTAEHLGVVSPRLERLGAIGLVANFDMARVGTSLRVSRLETSLAAAAPVAEVRALQSFEFNPATGELKVVDPTGDLVGITVKGLPLEWLMGGGGAVDLAGGAAGGEFVMRAEDGRLALRTRSPLVAAGASVSRSGRLLLDNVELSAFLLGDYAPQGWQLQFAPLAVRCDGTKILSIEARLGRLAGAGGALKAAGSWSGSVPGLLAQPFASALPRLAGGDASGNFEASLGATRSIRLSVALANLSLPGADAAAIPAITSEIRADFDASGHVTFKAPLHLTYPTHGSDLVVSGILRTENGSPFVDAVLSSTHLTAEDLAAVAAVTGGGRAAAAPEVPPSPGPAAAAPPAPEGPFWPGVRGRFELQLGELTFPRVDLHNLRGTLRLESTALTVEAGTANLGGESRGTFEGGVSFAPANSVPYTLQAKFEVANVDSAPIFQEFDPDRAALIEGRFTITGNVTGSGHRPAELLSQVTGSLRLSSKDGVFRALRTGVIDSIKQDPSKIANALDTVSALFGKKVEKVGAALVDTAKALAEIHYDQMSVAAERGADLNLRITEIAMIAPEERLTGKGVITYAVGVPLAEQPLSIDLDLSARGKVAKGMEIVGLLGDTQDELGYTRLYQPIHLGGTLRNVDQSQWKEMVEQAPLRKGGGLIDKLLGR